MSDTTAAASSQPITGAGRPPLKHWVMASFAAPGLPLALVGLPMAVYLPAVYAGATGYGLQLAVVGIVLTLTSWTGTIIDPIVGFISDRTRTRWGRRKPFIIIGTPIYALGIYMLFINPIEFREVDFLGFTFNIGYVWLFCSLLMTHLGSVIKDLPYRAWGAELSANYNERTKITSWREGFGVTGSLISAFTPSIIFFLGYTRPIDAVYYLSVAMLIIMPALVLNALWWVPEYPPRERVQQRIPVVQAVKLVFQNKIYLRYIVIFSFSGIGSTMTNALSFFFVEHVLIAGALYGFYLAPYFVSQVVSIPLWFKLSARIGKHRATMCAIGWYAFWACWIPLIAIAPVEWFTGFRVEHILGWLPAGAYEAVINHFEGIETGKFLFFIIIMCLKGSSIGALAALPQSMAADIVDYDTRTSGQQRAGAYFAIGGIIGRLSASLGVLIGTGSVVALGFDQLADPEHTTNTATALLWLACFYSVIPALFKFVAMPFLWHWPLTEQMLSEVQQDIYGPAAHAAGTAAARNAPPDASSEPLAEEEIIDELDEGSAPA